MKNILIADANVLNIWEDGEGQETHITPDWYQENGTPVCDCDSPNEGEYQEYSHTEIVTDDAYYTWMRKVRDDNGVTKYENIQPDEEVDPSDFHFETVEDAHAFIKGEEWGFDDLSEEPDIVLLQVACFEVPRK